MTRSAKDDSKSRYVIGANFKRIVSLYCFSLRQFEILMRTHNNFTHEETICGACFQGQFVRHVEQQPGGLRPYTVLPLYCWIINDYFIIKSRS